MCLEAGFNLMPEKYLHRKIQDIKVSCPQANEGCKWVGEIREVEKHLEINCDHIEILCPLGCGKTCKRLLILEHQEEDCPNRTPELKLSGLARKMEMRLAVVEAVMEDRNKSSQEILALKEELKKVNETNQRLQKKVDDVEAKLGSSLELQDNNLEETLKKAQLEAFRRCISYRIFLSLKDITWSSPQFCTHANGYMLQFAAKMISVPFLNIDNFTGLGGYSISLSLYILPRNEDILKWPVYVSVHFLIISKNDENQQAKIHSITAYKDLLNEEEDKPASRVVIGHSRSSYMCNLIILNVTYSSEPPLADEQ
jgi:hypothetical protein